MYLFRSLVNFLRRLIFNMGLWEIEVKATARIGITLIGAVTIVVMIIMAGNKGRPENLR